MEIEGITLGADVEGMSLYKSGVGGYLIVSSQGDYSYSVFDRCPLSTAVVVSLALAGLQ